VYYGKELMQPPTVDDHHSADYKIRSVCARVTSPLLAACMESFVSNRAEAQRFFGKEKFTQIETTMNRSFLTRVAGPGFVPNAMRNVIMCQTSFLLTPITYKLYFPQEQKSKTTLFWYGLGMNIFVGNVFAITQQALWGRSMDYLGQNGSINYRQVIQQGYAKEGLAAFFTVPKWFSRVLMNAPAQGTLPWFYNEVLPLGEMYALEITKLVVYDPFLKEKYQKSPPPIAVNLQRRTSLGSLSTAHPELQDREDPDVGTVPSPTFREASGKVATFEAHSPR